MNTSHPSAAVRLGQVLRRARQQQGLTIAAAAEQLGRPREWLNRAELGYSDDGVYRPPSASDLAVLADLLKSGLDTDREDLFELGREAEAEFYALRGGRQVRNKHLGRVGQVELVIGGEQVNLAISDLIAAQHSDAIIRNTGIRNINSYKKVTTGRVGYAKALGKFLADNPNALLKRVVNVSSKQHLEISKQADKRLTNGRRPVEVHNAKVKYRRNNPLHLHALIGQREAVLTFPQSSANSESNFAMIIRDKQFVEALRTWYDEILWEGSDPSQIVNFEKFDESYKNIAGMYGFDDK